MLTSQVLPTSSLVYQSNVLPVQNTQIYNSLAPTTNITTPAVSTSYVPQPLLTSMAQPLVQPAVAQSAVQQQYVITPVLTSRFPRPLAPSPSYERYIPPTPKTTSLLANETPRIYQFYHYAPASQVSSVPTTQMAAYSTISAPVAGVQTPTLSVLPQLYGYY